MQLVGCVDRVDDGPVIGQCQFKGETVPLYQARYRVDVYESSTGRHVTQAEVTGKHDTKECPFLVSWRQGDDAKVWTTPAFHQYQDAIGRYVDA